MKRFFRTLILAFVRSIGWSARKARPLPTDRPIRVLLLRPDHLGDLVLTTPVLQALRDQLPTATITLMIGSWSRAVVERHPALDQIIECPFPGFQRAPQSALAPYRLLLQTAKLLRKEKFDLAINLRPDFWWGAALIYLAKIPYRVGYAINPGTPFLTHTLPEPDAEQATYSSLRLVSGALRVINSSPLTQDLTAENYPLRFDTTAEEERWVEDRLQLAGLTFRSSIAIIHPGTGAAVKLWRPEAWSQIAEQLPRLSGFSSSLRIVLTGSPHEEPLLKEIAAKMNEQPLFVTSATVGQLAALMKRATVVLGVDNGPLHLAVAMQRPTIQLFGPTDTRIFGPWGPAHRHLLICATERCASCKAIPCGRLDIADKDLDRHPCVKKISEERVEETIQKLRESHEINAF